MVCKTTFIRLIFDYNRFIFPNCIVTGHIHSQMVVVCETLVCTLCIDNCLISGQQFLLKILNFVFVMALSVEEPFWFIILATEQKYLIYFQVIELGGKPTIGDCAMILRAAIRAPLPLAFLTILHTTHSLGYVFGRYWRFFIFHIDDARMMFSWSHLFDSSYKLTSLIINTCTLKMLVRVGFLKIVLVWAVWQITEICCPWWSGWSCKLSDCRMISHNSQMFN